MFTDMLSRFVEQCPGAVGAVLMGFDGIAVDQYYLPMEQVDLGKRSEMLRKFSRPGSCGKSPSFLPPTRF